MVEHFLSRIEDVSHLDFCIEGGLLWARANHPELFSVRKYPNENSSIVKRVRQSIVGEEGRAAARAALESRRDKMPPAEDQLRRELHAICRSALAVAEHAEHPERVAKIIDSMIRRVDGLLRVYAVVEKHS